MYVKIVDVRLKKYALDHLVEQIKWKSLKELMDDVGRS